MSIRVERVGSDRVYRAIQQERERQRSLWGDAPYRADKALPVLIEEIGEVARAILEKDATNLAEELVQVAAVCVRWLEQMTLPWECNCGNPARYASGKCGVCDLRTEGP